MDENEPKVEAAVTVTVLKRLDLNATEFMANGNKYFIEPELSADRYAKMKEFEIEFSFGVTYKKLFGGLKKAYGLVNEMQFADACVELNQLMEGIKLLDERQLPVLTYCTCFINREGEDRRFWDEKIMAEKIEDWKVEGINVNDFFLLAINSVRGLKESYQSFIQGTTSDNNEEPK